jgi:hypothetical protein
MGSPPGGPAYTNSRAAFDESYKNGFRAFEVDLVRLKDGNVILAHDRHESLYGLATGTRFSEVTTAQMRGRKYRGRWPVMFGQDLISLTAARPDVSFVLDAKGDVSSQVAVARWFARRTPATVRTRMFPHVHTDGHVLALKRLGFGGSILALYTWKKDALPRAPDVVRRNGLDTVMLPDEKYSEELRVALIAAGARWIFVHSFADPERIMNWRARGVGVYSDGWIGP